MNKQLAQFGGTPTVTEDHAPHLRWPILEQDDFEAVQKILSDGNISMHPVRLELEEAYKNYFNGKYALSHCNGTLALLASFFALELKPGDEVLVTSATWWASIVPLFWLGAIPVFCENEDQQFGICTDDMKKKVTGRTKAIVVVHLWGIPSQMEKIQEFAKSHNLSVIEDASHAHGAILNGKKCGQFGDLSVFSLQGDKLAPAGEGGILLTDNYQLWEKAVSLGDVTRIYQLETATRALAATSYGIKTRIAPMSAALGISQLRKLDKNNRKRNENIRYLSQHLEELGFETYMSKAGSERTYFEFLIRWKTVPKKGIEPLMDALRAEGLRVEAPRYPLLHQQPLFAQGLWKSVAHLPSSMHLPDYSAVTLPKTESTNRELIKLPHFSSANREFLDQYVKAFRKVMASIPEIYTETL